jgi:AcrR family transcriptional regulator
MTRPSRNTDQLLIKAARDLLPETGCTGLSLRQVAAKAGVNVGMFHYHFKTKSEFTHRVLLEVYEEFFSELSDETQIEGTSEDQLRKALWVLARFSRDQRSLLVALLRDVLNGDEEVLKFVKENFGRHFRILLNVIGKCREAGYLLDLPDLIVLVVLLGSVGIPHLIVGLLERAKVVGSFKLKTSAFQKFLLSEAAIQKRINLAIGVVFRPEHRKGKG